MNEWQEDKESTLRKTTAIDRHFLFTDTQIKEEGFLEDINNLLNSGEVPNLYPVDEKQEIIEKMRQIDKVKDKALQTDGSPVALFNMFIEGVNFTLFLLCLQLDMLCVLDSISFHHSLLAQLTCSNHGQTMHSVQWLVDSWRRLKWKMIFVLVV